MIGRLAPHRWQFKTRGFLRTAHVKSVVDQYRVIPCAAHERLDESQFSVLGGVGFHKRQITVFTDNQEQTEYSSSNSKAGGDSIALSLSSLLDALCFVCPMSSPIWVSRSSRFCRQRKRFDVTGFVIFDANGNKLTIVKYIQNAHRKRRSRRVSRSPAAVCRSQSSLHSIKRARH